MCGSLVRYQSVLADSARWNAFEFRDGDIIISAPVKCGVTWTQMICALLIFRQRTFPKPLDLVSPWLDMLTRPLEEVVRDLEAQQHRRFIKSHTPLDGLPFDNRVTYICIARDPRDVALSLFHHTANINVDALLLARHMAVGLHDLPELASDQSILRSGSEYEWLWQWIDAPVSPGLSAMTHHLRTFWDMRQCPNVILLHYDELLSDLSGQMRHLSLKLGEKVPETIWPELVQAATFKEMAARAAELVPNSSEGIWHEKARFFNRGRSGQWRQLLDDDDLKRYHSRISQLVDPELERWIHRGAAC